MTNEELLELQDQIRNPLMIILGRAQLSKGMSDIDKEMIIKQVKRINDYIKSKESCEFDFNDTFSSF